MSEKKRGPLGQLIDAVRSAVSWLREGPIGTTVDFAIEKIDSFLGPSGKAWVANGVDELRQAVALGNVQVQAGNNPGLWATITTGEATAERMAGDRDTAQVLHQTRDVPNPEQGKTYTLEELRGMAEERAPASHEMEHGNAQDHQQGHGR